MKDAKVDRERGGQVKLERFIEAEKSTVRKKKNNDNVSNILNTT